ncbi:MAG: hypothetical protein AAB038_05100 [Planctomycetota bacterium]
MKDEREKMRDSFIYLLSSIISCFPVLYHIKRHCRGKESLGIAKPAVDTETLVPH